MSKIKTQNSKRFVIWALLIAGMLVSYQFFKKFVEDPDLGDFQSAGHIVAIELNNSGGRVAMFDESGKRIDPPEPKKDAWDDREVSWSADGQRIFTSSNRELDSYNVYRWNPAKNIVQRRSIGSRSQGAPWFWPGEDPNGPKIGLIQSGGQIQELNITSGDSSLVMPPTGDRVEGTEEGSKGIMDAYDRFGRAFVKARYAGSKDKIYALMRNEEGYTLIYQAIGLDANQQPIRPAEMYRGTTVDVETDNNGVAAILISGFLFAPDAQIPEEFIVDGKAVPPFGAGIFRSEIGANDSPTIVAVVVIPVDAEEALGDMAVSPDGTKIAVVIGRKVKEGGFEPLFMLSMPFEENGGQAATPIAQGAISSPSWSPDGSKITYLKQEGANVDVYRANADGTGETKVTNGGKWAMPQFSPAIAK